MVKFNPTSIEWFFILLSSFLIHRVLIELRQGTNGGVSLEGLLASAGAGLVMGVGECYQPPLFPFPVETIG